MHRSNTSLTCLALMSIIILIQTSQAVSVESDATQTRESGIPFWLPSTTLGQPGNEPDNAKVSELFKRIGPNMRSSSDYHDFTDIGLNESVKDWQLLHKQALAYAEDQVHFYGPKLELLLKEANVSDNCMISLNETLRSLKQLDSWAVQSKFEFDSSS